MKSFVLFNNKGGVGKTTLTLNICHMLARKGLRTVMVDYDPQCNLSAVALSEDTLFEIWERSGDDEGGETVARCIDLVRRGKGDLRTPALQPVGEELWLLTGDLALGRFEQALAEAWGQVHQTDNERATHITTSLQRLAELAGTKVRADVVALDVGPNLGALNRAALLAVDAVLMPVAPDLFSLQGLRNIGPTIREWREEWRRVEERGNGVKGHPFTPRGYIVQQHLARADRPVTAYDKWAIQIPAVFHEHVLNEPKMTWPETREEDPYCIAMLKHFASLVPVAQLARKPIFDLKQADGIGGGQIQAVAKARGEFEDLVKKIRALLGL